MPYLRGVRLRTRALWGLRGYVPANAPANPIKARWIEFAPGFGIHGTLAEDRLGRPASVGCVRMGVPDVEDLYDLVEVGTPVHVVRSAPNDRKIVIDEERSELLLYEGSAVMRRFPVSLGIPGRRTPPGRHSVTRKIADPGWRLPLHRLPTRLRYLHGVPLWKRALWGLRGYVPADAPANPIKARWIEFAPPAGIHGTAAEDLIGSPASTGCVRMTIADIEELYDLVEVGTPVHVVPAVRLDRARD
jgi:lipoprotein-anchoring transpeptidase ErfK/SrfK